MRPIGGRDLAVGLFLVSLTLGAGCGAATLVVKEPVSNQCSSAGLKGCPELTDAVLKYVDGDKTGSEEKLRAVAKLNSPEQVKRFAEAIRPVGESIGGDAGKSLEAIATILLDAGSSTGGDKTNVAGAASAGGGTSPSKAGASRPQPNLDIESLRTGMARPASDPKASACDATAPAQGDSKQCKTVRVFLGPLVVTNVFASGGCPDELFVMAGRSERPHWVLRALPSAPLNVAGQFVVEEGEELFVFARSAGTSLEDDARCSVVWSGFRPLGTGLMELQSPTPPRR